MGKSSWSVDEDDTQEIDRTLTHYEHGSEEWRLILKEAHEDVSLRAFLEARGINPADPTAPAGPLRDTVLRKIKPLVLFRQGLSRVNPATGKRNRRSRKLRTEFFGLPAVFDISDGNPRFLKRIIEEMCAAAGLLNITGTPMVPRNTQSKILNIISLQFHSYIRGIPGSQTTLENGEEVFLYSLLHRIGKFFSSRILLADFSADPVTSFSVNDDLSSNIVRLLMVADEHAAIVRIDEPDSAYDLDMQGKRYRLSYLFAPLFQLPLRNYGSIALKGILTPHVPRNTEEELKLL